MTKETDFIDIMNINIYYKIANISVQLKMACLQR